MKTNVFRRGEQVKEEGEYVCVPCGFKKSYKIGEAFEECLSCMAKGRPVQELGIEEGFELWEKT